MNIKQNKTFAACRRCRRHGRLRNRPANAKEADPIGPKLTPRLKQMLSEEMLSVKQSAKMILDGLIVGDHPMVATQAQQGHAPQLHAAQAWLQKPRHITRQRVSA